MFTNARMYALNTAVESAWRELFDAVTRTAGVRASYETFAAPRPLGELWQRSDLACAFMCGYPWATWQACGDGSATPAALAAPIPAGERAESVYHSDIVVRADAPYTDLHSLFGQRMAWTVPDSQSGHQALRQFLAAEAVRRGGRLFSSVIGPLVTPRRVLEAVLAGEADAGPLDSYWFALLRRHEPALAAQVRIVARTPDTPMPLLVAAPALPAADRERITAALLDVGTRADLAPLRTTLCLAGFAAVDPSRYRVLLDQADEADHLGYAQLA